MNGLPHESSGRVCLVAHYGLHGEVLPPCVRCVNCGQFIRPEAMNTNCPNNSKIETLDDLTRRQQQ